MRKLLIIKLEGDESPNLIRELSDRINLAAGQRKSVENITRVFHYDDDPFYGELEITRKMMQEMIMKRHTELLAKGEKLFNDPKLGGASKGISCGSCHPKGGTTGGKAEIPKMHGYGPFQVPIPSLIGAAASFPKFKAPNADIITIS